METNRTAQIEPVIIAAVTLAESLKESDAKQSVRIIDEASFHLDRNQNYANMPAEKILRGKLRSDVDRSVSRGDIVIVDSLDSIKGYRYELWCIGRAVGIRYCVVYCDVDEAGCREWNKERSERGEGSYEGGVFEDLVRRFERPERRNRWDSPLLCSTSYANIFFFFFETLLMQTFNQSFYM